MTKKELIEALEALSCEDTTEILLSIRDNYYSDSVDQLDDLEYIYVKEGKIFLENLL